MDVGESHEQGVARSATREDVPGIAECLAKAFWDDPLWGVWAFPDEPTRARNLLPLMTLMAALSMSEGWTQMTHGGESVAIWTPPGASYRGPEQADLLNRVLAGLFGARTPEVDDLLRRFEQSAPEGDYYHLQWWATRPNLGGRGFGTKLLRENLERVDAERMPCYLESTNPVNLPLYEELGFRRLGAFAALDGPTITTMWREPRPAPQ